ncbi:rRNA methyltransferase, partial [Streptomyces sp. WAC04770]
MNVTLPTAQSLRAALAGLLDGLPPKQAAQAVDRLIASYRGETPTNAPILRDRSDVVAYAAYRMPATFEAVRSALDALVEAAPDWSPATHTDVGGGTGAAST